MAVYFSTPHINSGKHNPFWGGGWSPLQLGASLLAMWDAERADLITKDDGTGAVSSWLDVVGGYDAAQAVGASQPIWSATGFNSRPGITFDGLAHELTYASTTGLPTGATACEAWVLFDQTALAADTTARQILTWGGVTSATARTLRRSVNVGVNRASVVNGNGATADTSGLPAVDFSGRCVMRAIFSGTEITMELNGTAGTATASVPATGTTRLRIGASNGATAAAFAQGVGSLFLITALLDAAQATRLSTFLNGRR